MDNFVQSFRSQDCKLIKHIEAAQEFQTTIPAKARCFGPTSSTDMTIAVTNIPPWNIPVKTRIAIKNQIFGEKLVTKDNVIIPK